MLYIYTKWISLGPILSKESMVKGHSFSIKIVYLLVEAADQKLYQNYPPSTMHQCNFGDTCGPMGPYCVQHDPKWLWQAPYLLDKLTQYNTVLRNCYLNNSGLWAMARSIRLYIILNALLKKSVIDCVKVGNIKLW